jgi:hypothetical protein
MFVDYIHLLEKCYGILPCSMLLLSLAVALNNGQKLTQDTEFFWYYALPKNFGRLLHTYTYTHCWLRADEVNG